MRSLKKATIFFVAILLLFLLSFVSAELNRRDPQAPGDAPPAGGNPPADNPPAGGNPPAGAPDAGGKAPAGGNPPAGGAPDAGGKAPAGGNPPAGGAPDAGGKAPAGGAPDAGGKAPAGGAPDAGGKAPAGGAPAAGGKVPAGGAPAAGGKLPADGTTTGTNDTIPPKNISPLTPSVQINMVSPKMSSKNNLFKIGSNITFKWIYSSKFADPPKSISAYAQPQIDTKTYYPIALNQTLNETSQEVTWFTADIASSLPMSKYKLWICDQRGLVAPALPGGLQVFSGLEFGLYKPQDNNGNCPTCTINSAVSISIIPLLSTIGFTLITIISFNFILI